jgi:hypothetical protein
VLTVCVLGNRFKRPVSFLRFGAWMVITDHGVVPGRALEIRIFNERGSRRPVLDARVSLVMSWTNRRTSQPEHHSLTVMEEAYDELPQMCSVTHPIARKSLLVHQSWDSLLSCNTQFWVFVRGVDALTSKELVFFKKQKKKFTNEMQKGSKQTMEGQKKKKKNS